jgi:hypothetical protein
MTADKCPSAEPPRDDASPGAGAAEPRAAEPDVAAGQAPDSEPPAQQAAPVARPARSPEQTSDDTDLGWGEAPEPGDSHDRWLLEQRPPHWD